MRNPFRKKSPEEVFVDGFLRGLKETMGDNQDSRDMYVLIKSRRDAGDYREAQELANNFVQAAGAQLRAEKDREFDEVIERLKKEDADAGIEGFQKD